MDNPAQAPRVLIPLILFSAFLIMQANFLVLPALAVYMAKDLSLSISDLSVLLAVFSVAVAASNLFWSRVLDRFNRKSALLVGGFMVACIFGAMALASSYEVLVASRIAMAVAMPLMGASILPFVADIYAPKDRPRIMGYVMSAGYVVSLVVIPVVVMVSDQYTWTYAVFGLSAFTVLVFAVASFSLPKPETPKPNKDGAKPKPNVFVVENRPILVNLLRKFLQTAGIFTIFAMYPTWLSSGADGDVFDSSTLAMIFFVSGVMGFAGSMVSGRINDLLHSLSTRLDSLMLTTFACVAFCIVIPVFGKGTALGQFVSYAPMIFFQSVAVVLLMNSLITSVAPTERGFINAMSNVAFQLGIAFGSFLGVWMLGMGAIFPIFIVASVFLIASALTVFGPKPEKGAR